MEGARHFPCCRHLRTACIFCRNAVFRILIFSIKKTCVPLSQQKLRETSRIRFMFLEELVFKCASKPPSGPCQSTERSSPSQFEMPNSSSCGANAVQFEATLPMSARSKTNFAKNGCRIGKFFDNVIASKLISNYIVVPDVLTQFNIS